MSRNAYITEAFKQFNALVEEDELITSEEMPIYDAGSERMHDFLDTVGDDSDLAIIDLEAEAEEDLKQSYVGKVILDCNVCHSNIFIDKDEIVVDENGNANIELECPYCMSNEGYTIIGQVEPYEEETEEEEVESEDDIEIEEVPSEEEMAETEAPMDEGLINDSEWADQVKELGREADKGSLSDTEFQKSVDMLDRQLDECGDPEKVEEGLISDDEFSKELKDLGNQLKTGEIKEHEFNDEAEELSDLLDECGEPEKVQEELELDGEPELRGVTELRHRDDKEGVEEIRGKDNTELSGTDDLHESAETSEKDNITSVAVDFVVDYPEDMPEIKKELKNKFNIEIVRYDPDGQYNNATLRGTKENLVHYLATLYSGETDETADYDWVEEFYPELFESVKRKSVVESIENVSIDTEDETMTMTTKEDGGVVIETSPVEEEVEIEPVEEEIPEETTLEPGDEFVAPIDDSEEQEIELNSEVDALEDEDVEALEEPEEVDVTDFDEESFDELGESYLREHYDNVVGFKTVNAKIFENSLIVEGVIRFESGSSKGTTFVFEATGKENNNVLFEGYNRQISRGKKTFKLNCSLVEGCIKPEKMAYNYVTKNELNESVRVNGTVKVNKQ